MTPQEQGNESARILIIDDKAENRLLLSSQLRAGHNYHILQAGDGLDGIEAARRELPDLILLDVMMPRVDGFEVCQTLKDDPNTAHIPIIMVTALRDVKFKIQGIQAGADEFLSRPHHREELLVRVRSLIQLKRAREKLEQERNRLELLYDVSRATTAQLDLEEIMIQTISHIQAAVGAAKGTIILLDDQGQVLHKVFIRRGERAQVRNDVSREILRRGWAGWLVQNACGDLIRDVAQDERWVKLPDDEASTGSAIGAPLARADRVVGVLILTHPHVAYFSEGQLSLVETIAAQLTTAIENAYLFNAVSEQQRKLQAIYSQSNDAIISTEEDLTITLFNKSASKLFMLPERAVIGRHVQEVSQLRVLHPLFQQANSEAISQEVKLNGDQTLFTSISPVTGVGFIAVLTDITELKRIEEMRLEAERREKQMVKDTFSRYMGPRLVDHVLSEEPGLLTRRERRHAVVMFADLRGFTRMVIKLEPDTAIQILNEFFSRLTEIVHEFDGTIFDLAGDELMVGFNVPFDQPDAAYRGLMSAVAMQQSVNELRRSWFDRLGIELGLGVGIDQGKVVVGNVGAEMRMNFAMVGEAVNTAHRLVDMAADGHIVISDSVYQDVVIRVPDFMEKFSIDAMGEVSIKGKLVPEVLYRLELPRTSLAELSQRTAGR